MRIAKVQTTLRNFFFHWVNFTTPFHGLGKTEKKILAEFLYFRYLLNQEISNPVMLKKFLFDNDTRIKICDKVGIPRRRLSIILLQFKKAKIMVGGDINPKFIPDLSLKDKEFVLAFKFSIEGNEEGVYPKKSGKKVT